MKNIKSIIKETLSGMVDEYRDIECGYIGGYLNFCFLGSKLIFMSEVEKIKELVEKINKDTDGRVYMSIGYIEFKNGNFNYSTSFEYEEEDSGEQITDIFKVENTLNKYGYTIGL